MYACMTPVGFDTSDNFENHCFKLCRRLSDVSSFGLMSLHSVFVLFFAKRMF